MSSSTEKSGTLNETLEQRLRTGRAKFTRAERALANFMQANLERIPFETAASLADIVGTSKMTVSRFLRKIGYQGLAEVRNELRRKLALGGPQVSSRVDRFLKKKSHGERLGQSLELEIEALVKVYEQATTPAWQRILDAIINAEEVLVAGFQLMEGIASIFEIRLQLLRGGVCRLDGRNGSFAELFDAPMGSVLILFEMRRYSSLSEKLAHAARERGIMVVVISDPHCAWANDIANDVLVVLTESRLLWDGQAVFLSLINLLLDAVGQRLDDSIRARAKSLDQMVARFGLLV
jgi:DNA-binding MurR/RpiR family transcriptional regulator